MGSNPERARLFSLFFLSLLLILPLPITQKCVIIQTTWEVEQSLFMKNRFAA